MRSLPFLLLSIFVSVGCVFAQTDTTRTFSDKNADYTLELPSATWKIISRPTDISPNAEFVYGDRTDGYCEIRKLSVEADSLLSDVIQSDQELKLSFLPGYVSGKEEFFKGNLNGKVFNYEFTRSGKNFSGRSYYLQADKRTVYLLRFTGMRDKLRSIRNETDSIARTFKLKEAEKVEKKAN